MAKYVSTSSIVLSQIVYLLIATFGNAFHLMSQINLLLNTMLYLRLV